MVLVVLLIAICAPLITAANGDSFVDSAEAVEEILQPVRSNLYVDPARIYGERGLAAPAQADSPNTSPSPAPPAVAVAALAETTALGKTESRPAVPTTASERWAESAINWFDAVLGYIPRLWTNLLTQIFDGETAHSVRQVVRGTQLALEERPADSQIKTRYAFADSVANIPSFAAAVIADALSMIKWLFYSWAPTSSRIELCTGDLGSATNKLEPYQFVIPAKHIGIFIDGEHETSDPESSQILYRIKNRGGGVTCQRVPILSGESEPMAIERLACTQDKYTRIAKYHLGGYNCGGYTKDILNWSGLGYPTGANLGIGSDIVMGEAAEWSNLKQPEVTAFCSAHIEHVRKAAMSLEAGQPVDDETRAYFIDHNVQSAAIWIAFHAAAARGRHFENRKWIRILVGRSWHAVDFDGFYQDGVVKPTLYDSLSEVLAGLDDEAVAWLTSASPSTAKLRTAWQKAGSVSTTQ